MHKKPVLLALLFSSLLWIIACDKDGQSPETDPCNPANQSGELLEAKYFASYAPDQVKTYLTLFGAPQGLVPQYSVDAYQITYHTLDQDSELSKASGVLFIPQGFDTLDIMSVQHGTVFKKDEVGSVNPLYAIDGMLSAMDGYLVFEPDYMGLGESGGLHPYLHAQLSAQAVMDGLRATRIYACQTGLVLSERLFLAGYSEGGFVTLATHKVMESGYADEFQLTAVAPMAGPYDLLTSTRRILNRQEYGNPAYLAYTMLAYNDIYGWDRLDEIFREPYSSRIPGLFNGQFTGSEINQSLTTRIDSLFKPDFRSAFLAGGEPQIEGALVENSPLHWGPLAPVRLIHGTGDSTVYYENAVAAYASLQKNGALSVDLVPIQGADHGTAAFPAYYLTLAWFDSLRTED